MASSGTMDAILNKLHLLPTPTFPLSFVEPSSDIDARSRGVRIGLSTSNPRLPDVTAIILNWSRLDNVVHIVSLLCGPWLDDTIAEEYVWNNSPKKLSKEIFSSALCDTRKLGIENAPENLYFYARYLACAKASTPYCLIQDDDYVVMPGLIKTLRIRIEESFQGGIHRLRTTVTSNGVHTSFAWLGHGAMIYRQRALDFISLLHDESLGMPDEQIKMADNYFTVLGNEIPEIWFDQGIELEGGQPFTVGHEGDKRNQMHIENACRYLDKIVTRPLRVAAAGGTRIESLNFVKRNDLAPDADDYHINRAVALGTPYLLESNIKLLPDVNIPNSFSTTDMLRNEEKQAMLMGKNAMLHYQEHALSRAVDGNPGTAFRSPHSVKQGDYILIDVLSNFESNHSTVELVFLVAPNDEQILRRLKYECSLDGKHWLESPYSPEFRRAVVVIGNDRSDELLECSVRIGEYHARFFKATAETDISLPWVLYEVWVRSVSPIE